MKTVKLVLSIAISFVLLTTAQAANNGDPISASFDRDLNRAATTGIASQAFDADPLHHLVNVALWKADANQILASFDRDLNRAATTGIASQAFDADPLHHLVNVALWNTIPATPKVAQATQTDHIVISD